jgi:outer membrane protein OmpA-like peptidoglycan-associated protein
MRKLLLSSALVVVLGLGLKAQVADYDNDPFIGLKAGANYSGFQISGQNPNNYTTGWKPGFFGGLFGNMPLGKKFAIQPELQFSQMGGAVRRSQVLGDITQQLNYLSIPVMLKYYMTHDLRLLAGVQGDILMYARQTVPGTTAVDNVDQLNRSQFALTAGAEWWPLYNWGIGARYIHGLSDVSNGTNPTLRNKGIQMFLSFRFGKKPVPPPPPPPPAPVITDRDGDGIADVNDKCPDVPGLAKYQGCPIPDTDKDGINDEIDKCPSVPGLAKYQGCPIPDTDKDGINDEEDKCPTVPGLARYQGCPIPDTDGDGVNDEEDRCPNVPGIAENLGCIDLRFYYKRDVSTLSVADKANLDKVADFMQKNPDLGITVEGHTSTTGTAAYNQTLSQKRADNCVKYLIAKGIDKSRLTAVGFGKQFPIGDNTKEEGRALSRRVVFRVNK